MLCIIAALIRIWTENSQTQLKNVQQVDVKSRHLKIEGKTSAVIRPATVSKYLAAFQLRTEDFKHRGATSPSESSNTNE